MKFFLTLFATGAVAASLGTPVVKKETLVERDAAAISSAISSIGSALQTLQTDVQGFSGSGSADQLTSDSSAVLKAINSGDSAAKSTDQLSQTDALGLAQPIQDLGKQVNSTVSALIAKKQAFVSAGIGGTVLSQLQQQQSATKTFNTDLTAKIPQALQSTASSLAQPILDALNNGVAAFQDQAGSGSSASGSASATASASASATGSGAGSASASATATGSGSGSAASSTGGSAPTATSSSSNSTAPGVSSTAPQPTQSFATAGAVPTAVAGFGAAAVAALAAVAAF